MKLLELKRNVANRLDISILLIGVKLLRNGFSLLRDFIKNYALSYCTPTRDIDKAHLRQRLIRAQVDHKCTHAHSCVAQSQIPHSALSTVHLRDNDTFASFNFNSLFQNNIAHFNIWNNYFNRSCPKLVHSFMVDIGLFLFQRICKGVRS